MSYEEFKRAVQEGLREWCDGWAEVEICTMERNNGGKREAVCIRARDEAVSPVIYLDSFRGLYDRGVPMEEILGRIRRICQEGKRLPLLAAEMKDWDRIRERIGIKLIGREMNRDFLENVPHRDFLDLAVVYYVYLEQDGFPTGTAVVTRELLSLWGISEETLRRQAEENRKGIFAPDIRPVEKMISSILTRELERTGLKAEEIRSLRRIFGDRTDRIPMYVATNRQRFLGASSVLIPGVLKEVAVKEGWETCYVLPSSIHEMILIPGTLDDTEGISAMVRDINERAVEPEERLSCSVYLYSAASDTLGMA